VFKKKKGLGNTTRERNTELTKEAAVRGICSPFKSTRGKEAFALIKRHRQGKQLQGQSKIKSHKPGSRIAPKRGQDRGGGKTV